MISILVLNGTNLNLLGQRKNYVYGSTTLADIEQMCHDKAAELGIELEFQQSNDEGAMLEMIHAARSTHGGIILNAGAYTHTSVAIRDAISSVELPVVELHLSNIHAREEFRHHSYISGVALGLICGFGAAGYPMALDALTKHLRAAG